jgi:hypothetical protein
MTTIDIADPTVPASLIDIIAVAGYTNIKDAQEAMRESARGKGWDAMAGVRFLAVPEPRGTRWTAYGTAIALDYEGAHNPKVPPT